ncbi:MAG TPA: N(4)-(beta-N-acetylglucosaminyl)-L-asparaginase, partial [Longimicrobiales bacterium]
VHVRAARPVVVASANGHRYRNGGTETAVERAFRMITEGADVLDAVIAGVNIVELDPEDTSVGYGGLPNADGVVQLDASCMHGPRRRAGAVAALEGVRTPSLVAQKVLEVTDHHLLVGKDAQRFARMMGFTIEDDLNTPRSRELWLEWKRRTDPGHYPPPARPAGGRGTGGSGAAGAGAPGAGAARRSGAGDRRRAADDRALRGGSPAGEAGYDALDVREYMERLDAGWRAALAMAEEGLIDPEHLYGTINCNGVNAAGHVCGVTTTSGLAWKIPGRVGDSPILGAGLYVDGDVGAAGSTGRGEANLFGLCSFLIVEEMRRGRSPKDAGIEACRRIQRNTVEPRLLDDRGLPNFNVNFYIVNTRGEFAGVSLYPSRYAVCTENGPQILETEALLERRSTG